MKYDIIVIDSGWNKQYSFLGQKQIDAFCLERTASGEMVLIKDTNDYIGHGSAVLKVLLEQANDAKIAMIKLFNYKEKISEELLIQALYYIYENIETDFINISCGINSCRHFEELQNVCNLLSGRDVILVAACSNNKSLTFPAGCENVIGVDFHREHMGICYSEGGSANILIPPKEWIVPWLGEQYIRVSSTSFAVPDVVGWLYKIKKEKGFTNSKELKEFLRNLSLNVDNNRVIRYSKAKILVFALKNFDKIISMTAPFSDVKNIQIASHPMMTNEHMEVISWNTIEYSEIYDSVVFYGLKNPRELLGRKRYNYIVEKCQCKQINIFEAVPGVIFPTLHEKQNKIINLDKYNIIKCVEHLQIPTIIAVSPKIDKHYYEFYELLLQMLPYMQDEIQFFFMNPIMALCNQNLGDYTYLQCLNKYQQFFYYALAARHNALIHNKKIIMLEFPISITDEFNFSPNMINSVQVFNVMTPCFTFVLYSAETPLASYLRYLDIAKPMSKKVFFIIPATISQDLSGYIYELFNSWCDNVFDLRKTTEIIRLKKVLLVILRKEES